MDILDWFKVIRSFLGFFNLTTYVKSCAPCPDDLHIILYINRLSEWLLISVTGFSSLSLREAQALGPWGYKTQGFAGVVNWQVYVYGKIQKEYMGAL